LRFSRFLSLHRDPQKRKLRSKAESTGGVLGGRPACPLPLHVVISGLEERCRLPQRGPWWSFGCKHVSESGKALSMPAAGINLNSFHEANCVFRTVFKSKVLVWGHLDNKKMTLTAYVKYKTLIFDSV